MAHRHTPYNELGDVAAEPVLVNEQDVDDDLSEGESWDSFSDDGFEPEWASHIGETGDLLYIEPLDSREEDGIERNGSAQADHASAVQNHHVRLPVKIPKKQSKTIKKLKGLMGITKQLDATSDRKQREKTKSNTLAAPRTVTFQDSATGVINTVYLYVDPRKHNYGRRASICESLFGVVPGRFNTRQSSSLRGDGVRNGGPAHDNRIMVHALLPEGEAHKCGEIKIGDWLMTVNDQVVHFSNIDSVLAEIDEPTKVKVTLQKLAVESWQPYTVVQPQPVNESLVQLVSGQKPDDHSSLLDGLPYVAMYLTLECDSENANDKEDILYRFPKHDSKLVQIRGLFITLNHMLLDVTNNSAKNSTLLIEGQLVHVGYAKEGRQVLVIALPAAKVSVEYVNNIMEDIVRLLRVLHSSLGSAFSEREHHARLDHFFSLLFQRLLLPDEIIRNKIKSLELQQEPFLDSLPGARFLNLPEDVKVMVNVTLSEYEAAEFADMSDDYYDMRRSYTILGTSLFYKGFLVASHLHTEDLQDVNLYVKHYCLLALSAEGPVGQLVVWKEVFPTRRCQVPTDPLIPGYTEPDGRWFLMIIGIKHTLLCTLLEAGGCATWAEGRPTPDPFYIDQAKATILQLESQEFCLQCETRLLKPMLPNIANVDNFFVQNKKQREEPSSPLIQGAPAGITPKKAYPPESILKRRPSPMMEKHKLSGEYDEDYESLQSVPSEVSSPRSKKPPSNDQQSEASSDSGSNLFKSNRKMRNVPGPFDMSDMKRKLPDVKPDPAVVKLTSGFTNTLFHYLHFDQLDGIYLCPATNTSENNSDTYREIIANFYHCCLCIRKVFQKTINAKSARSQICSHKFGEDTTFDNVTEHGVLFECSPANWPDRKKTPPTISYWVIGRLFFEPYPRECYVCFHDSAEQNMIEMAFKLNFGVTL